MTDDYWIQSAALERLGGGMARAPDAPIWSEPGKVADGNLSEMLILWSALPASHKSHHAIAIQGDKLNEDTIRGLLDQQRHSLVMHVSDLVLKA